MKENLTKKFIPIYEDLTHVPGLLRTKLGLRFTDEPIDTIVEEIYNLTLQKVKSAPEI